MGVLVPGRIPDLMCRMAHSVRFGGMLLNGYCELMDDAREQQFAALTVELGPPHHAAARRAPAPAAARCPRS